MLLSDDVVTPM